MEITIFTPWPQTNQLSVESVASGLRKRDTKDGGVLDALSKLSGQCWFFQETLAWIGTLTWHSQLEMDIQKAFWSLSLFLLSFIILFPLGLIKYPALLPEQN